jgi:hypothetical protein
MEKNLLFATGLLAAITIIISTTAGAQSSNAVPLFDGQTLNGWIQAQSGVSAFGGGDITDLPAFAKKLTDKSDAVSAFISGQLDATNLADLAAFSPTIENAKAVKATLIKGLNKIISSGPVYDAARFQNVSLRPETKELLAKNPGGYDLARLNKLLIEDAYPAELVPGTAIGWIVKDGVMASTGTGRGVIYTAQDYSHYRLLLTMRHVSGKPDHPADVLFFCTRPKDGEKPLDALGGIQFQIPNGGHWDYRPGQGKDGGAEFHTLVKGKNNAHEWSRVEILVDAAKGTARLAVAQPPDAKAIELTDFNLPEAGKPGPIALQMHNPGLFDEYKDITIEVDPKVDDLITTQ